MPNKMAGVLCLLSVASDRNVFRNQLSCIANMSVGRQFQKREERENFRENVAKFMPSVAEIGGRPDKEMLSHYC
jgi:hypothetical protein